MRRIAVLATVLILGVSAAHAGKTKPAAAGSGAGNAAPGTSVEMPILVAPMSVDGKLNAYAYVSSTIVASSPSDAIAIRAKTPFIQDAFIRDVNGKTIVKAGAPDKVDTNALKARLLADVRRVVGGSKASAIQFTALQVTPLRPQAGQ